MDGCERPKFLVDANLPPAVASLIRTLGYNAAHVLDSGINLVNDRHILKRAVSDGYIIVTKDADFQQKIDHIRDREGELPPGIVKIRGNSRKEYEITTEGLTTPIVEMLRLIGHLAKEELGYLDVMIDRRGVSLRTWAKDIPEGEHLDEIRQIYDLEEKPEAEHLHEIRQIYDLEEKLEYYGRCAAIECYRRYGKDAVPGVDYKSILLEHGNLLKENLNYIKERIECAMKAGIGVSTFNSLSKVIFSNDNDFIHMIRSSDPEKSVLESMEFKTIEARVERRTKSRRS